MSFSYVSDYPRKLNVILTKWHGFLTTPSDYYKTRSSHFPNFVNKKPGTLFNFFWCLRVLIVTANYCQSLHSTKICWFFQRSILYVCLYSKRVNCFLGFCVCFYNLLIYPFIKYLRICYFPDSLREIRDITGKT